MTFESLRKKHPHIEFFALEKDDNIELKSMKVKDGYRVSHRPFLDDLRKFCTNKNKTLTFAQQYFKNNIKR